MGNRVVVLRVETFALWDDPLEALLGKDVEQSTGNLLYVLTSAMCQCQIGRIQDGQQLFHENGVGSFDYLPLLAVNALAVVVELGLEALQGLEVLVTLARQFVGLEQHPLVRPVGLDQVVRHTMQIVSCFGHHA
jgi:hypothetical protein